MSRFARWSLLLACATWSLAGCAGLETGSGFTEGDKPDATVKLVSSLAETLSGNDADGNLMTVDAARIVVEHVNVFLPTGVSCQDMTDMVTKKDGITSQVCLGNYIQTTGPWVVDLVTGESTPPINHALRPVESFRRIQIKLRKADTADGLVPAGDPLIGRSLLADGTLSRSSGDQAFRLALDVGSNLNFEASDVQQLTSTDALGLLMDVGTWFGGVTVAACADSGDLPVIDGRLDLQMGQGACQGATETLQNGVLGSTRLDVSPVSE